MRQERKTVVNQRNKKLVGLAWIWKTSQRRGGLRYDLNDGWDWERQREKSAFQASRIGFSKSIKSESSRQFRAQFSWSIVPMKWIVRAVDKGCSSMVKVLHGQNKPFGLHLVGYGESLKSLSQGMIRLKECFMTNLSAIWMMDCQEERLEAGWIIQLKSF